MKGEKYMNTKTVKAMMASVMILTLGACSQEKEELKVSISQTEHMDDGKAHVKTEKREINSGENVNVFDQAWTVTKTGENEYVLNTENQYHDQHDDGGYYLTDGFEMVSDEPLYLEDNKTNFTYSITIEEIE